MQAILLDGSPANDLMGQRVHSALTTELQAQGWQVEHVCLREKKIGNCAGDFFCWVRNPGICNVNDENRNIAKSIVQSDLMVYLTPITFGGYSSLLKKMVDHQIPNVSPFFTQIAGETHHQRRYQKYPDFLAVGWIEGHDRQTEMIFQHLAQRNAINLHAKRSAAGVVTADQTDAEIQCSVQGWLNELDRRTSGRLETNLPITEPSPRPSPIRSALLLVGSPRTRKSTSHSLGSYLFERLSAQEIETKTMHIHTSIRSPERMKILLEAVETSNLVLLAFPLYVDSLPAPTIEALERIAAQRASKMKTNSSQSHRQLFAVISNCGFPEPHHNVTALAICADFARQAGFGWAGSLALGAGEGMVHGTPLNELDGRALPLRKALDLAAEALAQGEVIPQEAQNLLAKPFIPAWMYRWMGIYGWRQQAKQYGMERSLKRRPYTIKER
ncbi:MAG: NAD(P)H dehydrogenase [Chloroflexi bacterium]|nr:MAG: NAD(P)H dehydrogenase [Chloroflexota bacterium]